MSSKQKEKWQYVKVFSALLLAGFLAAVSFDGFLWGTLNWSKLGNVGELIRFLLRSTAPAIVTAVIIYFVFETEAKKSSEFLFQEIKSLLEAPRSVIRRIDKNEFESYLFEFLEKEYKLPLDASNTIWGILKKRVFSGSGEYWSNVKTTFRLVGEADLDGYRIIRISQEYEIHNTNRNSLKFSCTLGSNVYSIINEDKYDISWSFLSSPNSKHLPEMAFEVKEINIIDDYDISVSYEKIKADKEQIIYESDEKLKLNGKKIRYVVEVKQAAIYGFISLHHKRLCHDTTTIIDYSQSPDIAKANFTPHILTDKTVRGDFDKPGEITVTTNGWILPSSGLTFSWTHR